jgi:circadian clock protein KaiC
VQTKDGSTKEGFARVTERSAATGIGGLDQVLLGGLTANRIYLIEGEPGAGKTTLGLQFLMAGVRRGEECLYVTLSESEAEIQGVADSHGWSLDGVNFLEMLVSEDALRPESNYTIFQPSEVELGDTVAHVVEEVEKRKPTRIVVDSLSEFRLLAQSPIKYRRQILALKQFFLGRKCTVLLLDDRAGNATDIGLHSIVHGVIQLQQLAPEFGGARRRLRVLKLRGRRYVSGYHDFNIVRGGLEVFPRLVAHERSSLAAPGAFSSGITEIDALLGGPIDSGTSTMLLGPAGSGKSTLVMQYVWAAARAGARAAVFVFDERPETLLKRLDGLHIDIRPYVENGQITIVQVDPAELSPGEFAVKVQQAVEPESGQPASLVVIDSLNGYMQAMPEERFLIVQLHELLTYLAQRAVATFLVVAQHGLVGPTMQAPFDATYLADTVLMFRYFEADGFIRDALSVVKRRSGAHERTLREFTLTQDGISVGPPLRDLSGVLTGVAVPAVLDRHTGDAE